MNFETKTGSNLDWPSTTVAGFRALACGRRDEAAGYWRDAQGALASVLPGDPRVASGLTNAGARAYLLGRTREAQAAFDAAEAAWLAAIEAVAALELPAIGASSAFHFTLASRNLPAFQDARRKRYAALCEACLAVTRFNRLFADAASTAPDAFGPAAQALAARLGDTFGPRAPEVRLLARGPAAPVSGADHPLSAYGDKAAEFESHRSSLAALLPDACRHLEAATALTALIGPWLLVDATGAAETPPRNSSSRSFSVSSHE